MNNFLYKNDVGTIISLNTGANISSATSVSIEVKLPDNTTASWLGVVGSDNSSVEHIIQSNEISQIGHYKLQAKVVMPSGTWRGETTTFQVKDVFQ